MTINKYTYIPENKHGRTFVVGDLHGCYSMLIEELEKVAFDCEKDILISVGDLVDRSLAEPTLECVALLTKPWFHCVRGNHEQFCIQGLGNEHAASLHAMHNNGGKWFYTLPEHMQRSIVARFKQLSYALETTVNGKRIGFVHADVPNDWNKVKELNDAPDESLENMLIWSRNRIRSGDSAGNVLNIDHVFLGHTPTNSIVKINNTSFIDTGAVFGGKLTLIDIAEYLK